MFNVVIKIQITQIPSALFPNRNKVLNLDFCEEFRWDSSWKNMTDKGKIVIPKNLFYTDKFGQKHSLSGSNVNIGGFSSEPLFMRGDRVILRAGYTYFKSEQLILTELWDIINGYISKVSSGIPIELDVEDNMWLLKQTPLTNRTFKASDTLEDILQFIINAVNSKHGTSLTINPLTSTNFGQFQVRNETAAQLLNRLHKTYAFTSYFRGNELRCGSLVYVESEAETQVFYMNGYKGNVLADEQNLDYQRKDDIVLSALAHNTVTQEAGGTCKDGTAKTKKVRLEVLVTFKNGAVTTKEIPQGEQAPANDEGERMEFFFPGETTVSGLANLATEKLKQYYYDGLKGSFKCWGIPYVKHGDWANIHNPKQSEQNGFYKVKQVSYEGGVNGLRQTVYLDFKRISE